MILVLALVLALVFSACANLTVNNADTSTDGNNTENNNENDNSGNNDAENNDTENNGGTNQDAHSHIYAEIVTPPTCIYTGYTTYKCICGDSYIANEKDPLGHTYIIATHTPTCTTQGYTSYTCFCGYNYEDSFVDPLGHSVVKDTEIKPTCTTEGLTEGSHCSVCYKVLVEQIITPKTNHTYDDKYDDSCNVCGFTRDVECPHTNLTTIPGKDATCTTNGLTEGKVCANCEEIIVQQTTITANGHNYKSMVTPPTCTQKGYTTYVCHCGDSYTGNRTSPIGHNYSQTVTSPTCTEAGYTTFICSNCDNTYIDNTLPPIGHKFEDNICVYCGYSNYSVGLDYTLSDDGTYYIVTGIGSCSGDIVVPPTHQSLPVKAIGDEAFYDSSKITSLKLGDNIVSIGEKALADSSIKSISIGKNITTLSSSVLYRCYNLTGITVDEDNTVYQSIDDNLYSKDGKTLVLYATGKNAYSFTVPEHVTTIGHAAFRECRKIRNINLYDNITTIKGYAFNNCQELKNINIPTSVTYIGACAFNDCSLINIHVPDLAIWCGITLDSLVSVSPWFNSDWNLYLIEGETSTIVNDLVIPDGVTTINPHTFSSCYSLRSVTIPASVKVIRTEAFLASSYITRVYTTDLAAWCETDFNGHAANPVRIAHDLYLIEGDTATLITDLVVPDGVEIINGSAFYDCDSLKSVTIPDSVTRIGSSAFKRCDNITSIVIPDSVTELNGNIFEECNGLETVVIGNGISKIPEYMCAYCPNLISVTMPDTIEVIQNSAFNNCEKLSNINIPGYLEVISANAFNNCDGITNVTLPDTLIAIMHSAFARCDNLTSVFIPKSVERIYDYAFSYCSKLTSITVDEDNPAYKSIDGNLYDKKAETLLQYAIGKPDTSFVIPDGVTVIGYQNGNSICHAVFSGAENLVSITIPSSVQSVAYVFDDCYKLVEVINNCKLTDDGISSTIKPMEVHKGESKIVYVNGYVFYTFEDVTYLIRYLGNDTELILPDSYNGGKYEIYEYAFYNKDNLTSVIIGNGATIIGDNAFYGCANLRNITIGNSVVTIGEQAFAECTSLVNVTISNSVVSIGREAFYNCTSLVSIDIPNGVTEIGSSAFSNCSNLTSITLPESLTTIGAVVFKDCFKLTSITVDANNENYQSIDANMYSKDGKTLIQYSVGKTDSLFTIPDGITSIHSGAFYHAPYIRYINMPEGLKSIGDYAFYQCPSLELLVLPESTTKIGNFAFASCPNLVSVILGPSGIDIGNSAFRNCYKLIEIIDRGSSRYTPGSPAKGGIAQYAKIYRYNRDSSTLVAQDGYFFLTYNTYNQTKNYILGYTDNATEIVLPSSFGGESYEITNYAFYNHATLESVTISSNVTGIGDYSFLECYNLKKIIFEGTVEQWNNITKGKRWDAYTDNYTVYCTDGEIAKSGTVTYY